MIKNPRTIAECITFKKLITEVYPSGVVSLVSDSFSYWDVLTQIAPALKEVILARQPNSLGLAKVVFRPDSGDPADIICGLRVCDTQDDLGYQGYYEINDGEYGAIKFQGKYYYFDTDFDFAYEETYNQRVILGDEVPEHLIKGSVECLWDIFGGTVNEAGYKELNPRVGLIYGDSITLERAQDILQRLEAKGFASSNIVFGIGSYTYQYVTRDSFGFAMKATFGVVNGEDRVIYKDPKTGDGGKKSARGLLRVEKESGRFVLYDNQTREQEAQGELKEVFRDSVLLIDDTLEAIRGRLHG